jgi:hypothetical protein
LCVGSAIDKRHGLGSLSIVRNHTFPIATRMRVCGSGIDHCPILHQASRHCVVRQWR